MEDAMQDLHFGAQTLGSLGNRLSPGPRFGHVSFQRQDGPASVSITTVLSEEASVRLDAFLRELIAGDAPMLQAIEQQQMLKSQAAQERAMRQVCGQSNKGLYRDV